MNQKTKIAPLWLFDVLRVFIFVTSKILWRIKFYGTEHIPKNLSGGLIITPNHQTYFDPFWICVPVRRRFRFMAWNKAFDWFLIGKIIRYLGAFPVSIERGGSAKKAAMEASLNCLKEGSTLMIFPEGSREHEDGNLLEFKTGAVRIALETNVPILPVTIRGANKIWSQDRKYPRIFQKVEIYFHPIFEVKNENENEKFNIHLENETERLKQIIGSKLNNS
jgi:1-acyl-sn-glycerol-3-phosphate acyltransferase